SKDLPQVPRDAAQDLLNVESGVSLNQIAQIWSVLGLDKEDPFLKVANDRLSQFSKNQPTEMYDVMISYQRNHISEARQIKDSLETRGLSVWFDIEIASTADIYSRMAEGILMSKVVVPCLTVAYESDPDRKKELGFAADQVREGKKVVPVRLEDGPFTWSALVSLF
ncbi:hypothetical protein HK096_009479, partial [Nowakowskiella sp. JEL0078]